MTKIGARNLKIHNLEHIIPKISREDPEFQHSRSAKFAMTPLVLGETYLIKFKFKNINYQVGYTIKTNK